MNLWVVFLTGLTVGGLTCLAVQGGLLASTIAARKEEDLEKGSGSKYNLWPILAFLTSKFIVYTIFGFSLGLFGQTLALSDTSRIIMQFVAGLYMIVVGLNLLNVHPIFRYAILQPPKFLTRLVRTQSKSKDIFAPALLGMMTIFIPCGTTLAMETLAISSGDPLIGASIMAVFTLGTVPLFFGLGFLTTTLGDAYKSRFLKLAAIAVMYLGLSSVNGSLLASGSPITFQSIVANSPDKFARSNQATDTKTVPVNETGEQVVAINVEPNGYSPNYFRVKAESPVAVYLTTSEKLSCTAAFRIPSLGINKTLSPSFTDASIKFTPQKPGRIAFTCSMGMYSGVIEVT